MIEALLLGSASVVGAVGARVYDSAPRQSAALPYIVVLENGSESPAQLDGLSAGVRETRFTIEVVDDDREDAYQLAELVRLWLEGYRGDADGEFVNSSVADGTPRVVCHQPRDKSDARRWAVARDYLIFHEEAVHG